MDTRRIKMGHPAGQTPPNIYSDFDWIRRHEKELLEQYGECSIIVYQEQVIGTGASYGAAVQDAENKLTSEIPITPVHHRLAYRNPFIRGRLTRKSDA